MSAWRHLRAVALLPVMATIVVPAAVLAVSRSASPAWRRREPARSLALLTGGSLVWAGLVLFGWTNVMFARVGKGTLAPWDPTERLVVRGVYRHVRNPMISGVFCILLGEATLLGSRALLGWALCFFLGNAAYIPLVEERDMERRFGAEYIEYKRHVPRWLPRVSPWRPA